MNKLFLKCCAFLAFGLAMVSGAQAALVNHALNRPVVMTPAPALTYWGNQDWPLVDGTPTATPITMDALMARLTDGTTFDYVEATTTTDPLIHAVSWTAEAGTQSPRVAVIDLGEVQHDIVSVRLDNPVKTDYGPKQAQLVEIYGSTDGVDYTYWGAAAVQNPDADNNGTYYDETAQWALTLPSVASARYVKFQTSWNYTGTSGTETIYELYVYGDPSLAPALVNYALNQPVVATPAPALTYWGNQDWPLVGGTPTATPITMDALMARLTDGTTFNYVEATTTTDPLIHAVSWTNEAGTQSPRVAVVDLGAVKTDIVKVQADNPVKSDYGPKQAQLVEIYGSTDGVAYTYWGAATIANPDADNNGTYYDETAQWVLETSAKAARYVKFEFTWNYTGTAGTETLYELYVFGGQSSTPPVAVPVNYARGKVATVTPLFPMDYWVNAGTQEATAARLTDGLTNTTGNSWGQMAAYNSTLTGVAVITIDLEEVKTDIARMQVDSPVNTPSGVRAITSIVVAGSTDGANFTDWGNLTDTGAGNETMHSWLWNGEQKTARYVRYTIDWSASGTGAYALYELYAYGNIHVVNSVESRHWVLY